MICNVLFRFGNFSGLVGIYRLTLCACVNWSHTPASCQQDVKMPAVYFRLASSDTKLHSSVVHEARPMKVRSPEYFWRKYLMWPQRPRVRYILQSGQGPCAHLCQPHTAEESEVRPAFSTEHPSCMYSGGAGPG